MVVLTYAEAMNEHIVEIEYWVNQMLPVEGQPENSLALPSLRVSHVGKRFCFQISIHLTAEGNQPTEQSKVVLSHDGNTLVKRQLTFIESQSILQKISCLKLSFGEQTGLGSITCPSEEYGVRIRRGTVLMELSWADGEHITTDTALLDALTNLVADITKLESVRHHELELGIVRKII